MNKEQFTEELILSVASALPPSFASSVIHKDRIEGFNGKSYDAILIFQDGSIISPAINVDQYFEEYNKGRRMDDITKEVVFFKSMENTVLDTLSLDQLNDYDFVKDKLSVRICDTEKNKDAKWDGLTKQFGDFTAEYRIILHNDSMGDFSTSVNPDMLEKWGITPEELHQQAVSNLKPILRNVQDVVFQLMGEGQTENLLELEETTVDHSMYISPLYMLSVESMQNGAAVLLNPEVMKKACEVLGDNCYVLPSSIHENLLVTESYGVPVEELVEMVQQVNGSVSPDEILSDKVQYCDKETGLFINAQEHLKELQMQQDSKQKENEMRGPSL